MSHVDDFIDAAVKEYDLKEGKYGSAPVWEVRDGTLQREIPREDWNGFLSP